MTAPEQTELELLWAKATYTNAWSFNSMENPFLQHFFQRIRPAYKPPTRRQLSVRLLEKVSSEVEAEINYTVNKSSNVTLMLDGWSDVNRRSLVNIVLYTDRPVFLK